MTRGILYIPGAGQYGFNQSAHLVADRIARAFRCKLVSRNIPFHYRIMVAKDEHRFEDIPIDTASIEVTKKETPSENDWKKVLDVVELKYYPRFTKSFSDLSHLERVFRGVLILLAARRRKPKRNKISDEYSRSNGSRKSAQQRKIATNELDINDEYEKKLRSDTRQVKALERQIIRWLFVVLVYWALISVVAVLGIPKLLFGIDILTTVSALSGTEPETLKRFVAVFALLAVVLSLLYYAKKSVIESTVRQVIDHFSTTKYLNDERDFLVIINAILDCADYLTTKGYKPLDMVSLSLGAILSTDAVFRKPPDEKTRDLKNATCLSAPKIDTWITIGFPYKFVDEKKPQYFRMRERPLLNISQWLNVWIENDPLASLISPEGGIGIACADKRDFSPHSEWSFKPDKKQFTKEPIEISPDNSFRDRMKDSFVPKRFGNHCLYWDDQNARATSCFEKIIDEAKWTEDLEKVLQSIS